jgi:hypothetical protein
VLDMGDAIGDLVVIEPGIHDITHRRAAYRWPVTGLQ